VLFLFPFERLDTGRAGFEQGRDRVEFGFGRLRLAVGCIERDFRLALVGDGGFRLGRRAVGGFAQLVELRPQRLQLVFGRRARGGFLVAPCDSVGSRGLELLGGRADLRELFLRILRLLLFGLQLPAQGVELRPRVFQRNRERFLFTHDLGELGAKCIGNLPRFGGEVLQSRVRFGRRHLAELFCELVDVAIDVRLGCDGFFEGLGCGFESSAQRIDPFQGRLGCGAENLGQQRGRFFCRKGTEFHEKGAPILQGRSRATEREFREDSCRLVANPLQRGGGKYDFVTVDRRPGSVVRDPASVSNRELSAYFGAPGGLGTT